MGRDHRLTKTFILVLLTFSNFAVELQTIQPISYFLNSIRLST